VQKFCKCVYFCAAILFMCRTTMYHFLFFNGLVRHAGHEKKQSSPARREQWPLVSLVTPGGSAAVRCSTCAAW
jgi:hypothetical protein